MDALSVHYRLHPALLRQELGVLGCHALGQRYSFESHLQGMSHQAYKVSLAVLRAMMSSQRSSCSRSSVTQQGQQSARSSSRAGSCMCAAAIGKMRGWGGCRQYCAKG